MSSKPLVSAVVANWNGERDLEICLPTLVAQSYQPLEIIVVDNASADDSAAVVSGFAVAWLPLARNLGLAGALNKGAEAAEGEFVLFLNNDMRFHERFVESLVSEIVRESNIFSVDALQYDWEGTRQVHLATRLANKHRANSNCYAFAPALYIYQESSDSPTPIPSACAASMLVRKSMFQDLGGFDKRLPLGYEDLELCWRAWIRGWKSIFAPLAVCWHRVGGVSGSTEGSRVGFRGTLGGRLLLATKLLPLSYTTTTWLATFVGLARDVAAARWQRVRDRIGVVGLYAGLLLPLLRERRAIYGSARTSPKEQLLRLLQLSVDERSPARGRPEPPPSLGGVRLRGPLRWIRGL
jgi:GT2 family glycosyltransferase